MNNAVTGKLLWVDLSQGTCVVEKIPDEVYENCLSGIGLAAAILYQRIPAGADALGPENVLAFVSGLLTGTGSLMTGRWMAAAKSPLTGGWGDANCGGTFSPAIKQCGFDGIFFSGISPRPVYLVVERGRAELRDAADLWGKDTLETEQLLQQRTQGKPAAVACIGPAGEKCSLIAGISNDGGRLAARSGLGAVMGSKRLKAVVLHGAQRINVHDAARMERLSERFHRRISFQPPFFSGRGFALVGKLMGVLPLQMRQDGMLYKFLLRKWGTISMNQASVEMGDAPIRNWQGSSRDFGLKISAAFNPDRILAQEQSKYYCYSCPLGCGGICRAQNHAEAHKPEYETVLALGGLLMNEDLDSIFRANDLLNRAGMDSISAGGALAFAFECFEKGLITLEDTGGLQLTWGNTPAVLGLLEKMIAREGVGAWLADGVRAAAARIGHGAEAYAVQAGGQELAMHDSRNDPGFALHAVVEPTPGRHTIGSYLYYEMFQLWTRVRGLPGAPALFYPKGRKYLADREKAQWAAACSQFNMVMNGAGLCLFGGFIGVQRIPIFEWLNAATGWQRSPNEYMQIGLNIQNLRQAFNLKHGVGLRSDISPRALGKPPLREGANRGRTVMLDDLVRMYWQEMGWNEESGMPDLSILERLGITAETMSIN